MTACRHICSLAGILCLFLLVACNAAPVDGAALRVKLPHGETGSMVVLQITVGALPDGADLRVFSDDGELLGNVAPFGVAARKRGGTYTLALPDTLQRGSSDTLMLHVLVFDAQSPDGRGATTQELLGIDAASVPVREPDR